MLLIDFVYLSQLSFGTILWIFVLISVACPQWKFYATNVLSSSQRNADKELYERLLDSETSSLESEKSNKEADVYWKRSNKKFAAYLTFCYGCNVVWQALLLLNEHSFWYRYIPWIILQANLFYCGVLFVQSAQPIIFESSKARKQYRSQVSTKLLSKLAWTELLTIGSTVYFLLDHTASKLAFSITGISLHLVTLYVILTYRQRDHALFVWENDCLAEEIVNKELNASLWSRYTFSWLEDLIEAGYRKSKNIGNPLSTNDLWRLLDTDMSKNIRERWALHASANSLIIRIFFLIRKTLIRQFLYAFVSCLLFFSGPFFLNRILYVVEHHTLEHSLKRALLYVVGMFISSVVRAFCDGQTYYLGRKMGLAVRASLIASLYDKSLIRATKSTHTFVKSNKHKSPKQSDEHSRAGTATSSTSTAILNIDLPEPSMDIADERQAETTAAIASLTSGEIVNLMAVDAQKISDTICYFHYFWVCPTQIAIAAALLLNFFSWPALGGMLAMVLVLPVNGLLGRRVQVSQSRFLSSIDRRMRAVSEILQGIKVIKFLAWEPSLVRKLIKIRSRELQSLKRYLLSIYSTKIVSLATPILASGVSFFAYTKIAGWPLSADTAFTALALFNNLRSPLSILPEFYLRGVEGKVSIRRMQQFLLEKEIDQSLYVARDDQESLAICGVFTYGNTLKQPSKPVVSKKTVGKTPSYKEAIVSDASMHGALSSNLANSSSVEKELAHASGFRLMIKTPLHFPIGKLSLVIGPTGSGKSSLLLALLQEIEPVASNSNWFVDSRFNPSFGKVCFVPQTAWLQNATIRENITFGREWDHEWYNKVLHACALKQDLLILEAGDLTEIGEKGVNLSGGQRQRICLARAVYSMAPIVLLDDCLSAVDAPTAKHLFNECITKILVRQQARTVILVTHAVSLCAKKASSITLMAPDGSVVDSGSYSRMEQHDFLRQTWVQQSSQHDAPDRSRDPTAEPEVVSKIKSGLNENLLRESGRLTKEEDRATGSVSIKVYKRYISASGGLTFLALFILAFALAQGLNMAQDFWVMRWSAAYKKGRSSDIYLWVYLGIGGFIIFAYFLRLAAQMFGSLSASKKLHDETVERLFRAPIRFFDTTPQGSILNRLGKDIQAVDQEIMPWLGDLTQFSLMLVGIVSVILYCTPSVFIGLIPVTFVALSTAKRYLSTSRELKRLDSITRSPIYSFFSETMTGIMTVRAFGAEARFKERENQLVDINNKCYLYLWASNRWLGLRVDLIGAVVGLLSSLAVVLAVEFPGMPVIGGRMTSGLAGVSLSFTLMFTESLLWLVRLHALLEMSLNSVERLEDYLKVDEEKIEGAEVPNWPSKGQIEISNLRMRYGPNMPCVLNGLTCSIPGGTKVGIIGRTGAGKSSLVQALFRLTEADSGKLEIDGIDISTLNLHFLRSRITIIPQDPLLFTGTIRSNLDMFDQVPNDSVLQSVLDQVGMGNYSLDHPVSEFGGGFSQGQRQLLCLVRAFLRQSSVVVLDEPTSSVDHETDALIQKAVRRHCKNATVLCIAHRLRSIADFDLVLVLDNGAIVEQGSPLALMTKGKDIAQLDAKKAKESSCLFWSMCIESGEPETLLQIAVAKLEKG